MSNTNMFNQLQVSEHKYIIISENNKLPTRLGLNTPNQVGVIVASDKNRTQ